MTYSSYPATSPHYPFYPPQYQRPPQLPIQPKPAYYQQQPYVQVKQEYSDPSIPPPAGVHSAGVPHTLPIFRFGDSGASSPSPTSPVSTFSFMSHPWASSSASASAPGAYQHHPQYAAPERMNTYSMPAPMGGHPNPYSHQHTMALADEYDDGDGDDGDLGDLPSAGSLGGLGLATFGTSGSTSGKNDKTVRRRSSKACDQCRKSKCKCERSSAQEPCRNCVMQGTPCTFLGPSRKRGPPKGYIDAIEARLHQTEALIGILLGSKDARARSLIEDLKEDPLAKEIISRVDDSPYGFKGRSRGAEATVSSRSRPAPPPTDEGESGSASAHPSNEWQDKVTAHLNASAASRKTRLSGQEPMSPTLPTLSELNTSTTHPSGRPTLKLHAPSGSISGSRPTSASFTPLSTTAPDRREQDPLSARRQRRRLDGDDNSQTHSPSTASASARSCSPTHPHAQRVSDSLSSSIADLYAAAHAHTHTESQSQSPDARDDSSWDGDSTAGEDELAVAVGQLSLNEDEQVRYHGKASGLHLLGAKDRDDGRTEGGIWRFPKARVWPPLPPTLRTPVRTEEEMHLRLPELAIQEHLLELYFVYVHPALPVIQKKGFWDDFRNGNLVASTGSPYSTGSHASEAGSPAQTPANGNSRRRRVPTLLLLAMFAIAARYAGAAAKDVPLPEEGSMWSAGDQYLEDAKVLLDSSYAASRPSTCQALLLMGYREVGIGAMAQAWLYIGMAVRMAQDLGMHKKADQWLKIGKNLFEPEELQERRRIWYGCVVMDKYVSTYIGRPVAIFERDFDTDLPSIDEPEELELWKPHPSKVILDDDSENIPHHDSFSPSYVISCFNESSKLSIILSMILQTIYPIRPHCCRQNEFTRLETLLSKWYNELPVHLRFDPAATKKPPPPPHVMTLHMQYWCTVILLHRPFMGHHTARSSSPPKDGDIRANHRKNYDLCVQAANQITSIASVYVIHHCSRRASVYSCYYIFTASVMHVTTLMTYPEDTQARIGLTKCMDALKLMRSVWPSAWRALQLLSGSKVNTQQLEVAKKTSGPKRTAQDVLNSDSLDKRRSAPGDMAFRPTHGISGSGGSGSQSASSFPPMGLDLPNEPSSYFQPYDRWSADGQSLPHFGGSMSTSVLPQQYSTGLTDERAALSRPTERQNQRFPQYWQDYSALGQMDVSTYGVPVMVPQHSVPPQSEQSTMFQPDQYSMFSNLPSSTSSQQ